MVVKVLNELIFVENMYRFVIVYGFFVGGYFYSYVFNLMEKLDKFFFVKIRICG